MKNFKIIICIMLVCALLAGCVRHENLKDLIIVEGMALDSEESELELTVQSLNVGMSSGVEKPQGNMTVNSSSKGITIVDAVSNMSKQMSKEMFFGNNKIIAFGKSTCENDFEDRMDYFLRAIDSRADVAVCMVDGKAAEILESSENDAHVPVENIVNLIYTGEKTGHSIYLVTEDLLNYYSDKTTDVCLPVVKINEKSETVQLSGIAVFDDDRLSYIMNDEQTLGFSLINGKVEECIIEFDNDKFGKTGIQITEAKASKRVSIVDGGIVFCVDIKAELLLNELERGIVRALNQDDLDYIIQQSQSEVERLCINAFRTCQQNNSDCLRVGEYLARDSAKSYQMLSDDWKAYYKDVRISVNSSLKLKKISDNTQLD